MAIIKCKECGKDISDQTIACIHCGYPVSQKKLSVDIPKCDIKIRGNEKLPSNLAGLGYLGFVIVATMLSVSIMAQTRQNGSAIIFFIVYIIVMVFLFKKNKAFQEELGRVNKIYEYFKVRYPIYAQLTPDMGSLGLVTAKSDNSDEAMFDIFMQAHARNADGIILQGNTTSTHVSGGHQKGLFPSGVSSSTTHHVMATLVKYK